MKEVDVRVDVREVFSLLANLDRLIGVDQKITMMQMDLGIILQLPECSMFWKD